MKNSKQTVAQTPIAFRDRVHKIFSKAPAEKQAIVQDLITLAEGSVSHQSNIVGDSELEAAVCIMEILADIHVDYTTLLAAFLYALSVVNALEWERIESEFDEEIKLLVGNIQRLHILQATQIQSADHAADHQQIEGLRRLLLALAADVRVVLVQLAERIYLLRNSKQLSENVRHQIAEECMVIYAPLANRLGIWQFKWELEDLSFRYLEPETYRTIAAMLDEKRVDREQFIEQVLQQLRDEIAKLGIKAEVSGRPKHIYSIWRKMKKKGLDFHELFDVRAARVLVERVSDCYMVLGVVHTLWRPIKSEFDDYIASPKPNNYQSLHTAVIGPEDKTLEVQIRTFEMHENCEFGFASHWSYKEGGRSDQKIQQQINSLRRLLEMREDGTGQDGEDSEDSLLDQLRNELLEERVYVLTPKNQVIDLPYGATTLDFAYAIHSEVGHHYRGAKVDGTIVPQGYRLQNGQQVEILTTPQAHPSRDWLNPSLGYAQSSRTRAKIRAWFRQQDFSQNRSAGQHILEQELKRLSVKEEVDLQKMLKRFNQPSEDDFYAALGRGDISLNKLASALSDYVLPKKAPLAGFHTRSPGYKADQAGSGIQVMGVGDLLVTMAKCCKPVPYDNIVGYITRGRGVTVHRADCSNLLQMELDQEERFIEVNWGRQTDQIYPVEIAVRAFDRQGLLQDITTILTTEHLNVTDVNTHTDKKTCIASMSLSVEVTDAMQLSRALTRIEHLSNVLEVSRK